MTTGTTVRKVTLGHEHPGPREKENAEAADAAVRKALRVETADHEPSGLHPALVKRIWYIFLKRRSNGVVLSPIGLSSLLETFDFCVSKNRSTQASLVR